MVKRFVRFLALLLFVIALFGIKKKPLTEYKTRRDQLATHIKGNALVLRAAPDKELTKYYQEENF